MRVPLTPLDFYRRSRRLFGTKIGVIDRSRRLTFGEFGDRVERLAGVLKAGGLRAGEPVSVLGPNTHHLLEAFYGAPLAGGIVNPINPRLAPLEIAQLVNFAGSRTLLFHADLAPTVREILGNLKAIERFIVLEGDPRALDFPAREYESELSRARPVSGDVPIPDEDAPAALFYTSGGMTAPRGVLLSHRALHLHALYAVIAVGLREDDVSLCTVPFAYMNGGGNPQMTLAVASPAVLAGRTDPDTVLALIDTERPTVWITAPRVLQRLLRAPSFDRFDTSSLRLVLVGGAPIPEAAVAEAEERLGARCVSVYGLTETAPFVSAAVPASGVPAAERRAVQATAGLPVLGVETKVVDQDGREVPPDGEAVGEILVRGHAMMQAYHRDPEATRDALAGGWLRTGDLAVVDARGYLTLRGRTRDVIIVGGMHVDAEEIEAALAAHPAVAQCSVVAVSDAEWGEVPIALVVLAPGARVTESDLLAHARQRLAWFKVPRSIRFLETLPTSEAGKVLKSELRTLYAG